jgi:hypothetical protein
MMLAPRPISRSGYPPRHSAHDLTVKFVCNTAESGRKVSFEQRETEHENADARIPEIFRVGLGVFLVIEAQLKHEISQLDLAICGPGLLLVTWPDYPNVEVGIVQLDVVGMGEERRDRLARRFQ